MKKILVALALVALVATPVFSATIQGSKHDLSGSGPNQWGNGYNRICALCHTPHEASVTAQNAPLWNRTYSTAGITVYNAVSTTDAVFDAASYGATDAPLCLSCHDGASMTDALVNPPNSGGSAVSTNISSTANLGRTLGNDHPIGFNYQDVIDAGDTEIRANPVGITFYGTAPDTGMMWCSSCHDVHDPANTPFLVSTNVQSALCLTCHIK
mgnify:FL=1